MFESVLVENPPRRESFSAFASGHSRDLLKFTSRLFRKCMTHVQDHSFHLLVLERWDARIAEQVLTWMGEV